MSQPSGIESFWQAYIAFLPDGEKPIATPYGVWQFGDTRDVATKVGHLARRGIKTATSGLAWEMESDGEKLPQVGDVAIVTDGEQNPLCLIEIMEVQTKPFNEVDEQFAFDYGEGDRTLMQWRADSWDYFTQCCRAIGREPSETMPMVCQRFRLRYPK